MSEYMEYAIGVNNAKRDLDQLSASQTTVNQQQSVTAFRELILSRPDVGTCSSLLNFSFRPT